MNSKHLSLSGTAVIAILSLFAFSGDIYWDCYHDNTSNTNPPPPTRSIQSVREISDSLTPQYQHNNGSCTYDGSQASTQPHLWQIYYSDNTVASAPILWPYNKTTNQRGYLNYYLSRATPEETNAVDAAINAWNSALTRDVSTNGTIMITLAKSSSPYSPIQIYGDGVSGNLSLNSDEAGAEAFGGIPAPYTTLHDAQILIDPNAGTSNFYSAALHEIGHSLGLDHNIDRASVMWPTTNTCFPSGTVPSSIDTSFLETKYDPVYINKPGPGDGTYCPRTGVCSYSRRRMTQSPLKGLPVLTVPQIYASAQAATLYKNASFASKSSGGPTFHVHLEDSPIARSISLESLTLASSLVATVDVMTTVRYVQQGPVRYAIRSAKVSALQRHALSPDETRQVGDVIYFADREFGNGESFIDDPALYPGSHAVVFLQRYDEGARRLGLQNLYRFTARSVSKLGVYRDGRVAQLAAFQSRMMDEVDGKTVTDLYRHAVSKYGLQAMGSEETALRAALAVRGVRSPQQLARYRQSLVTMSPGTERWAASTDRSSGTAAVR